MVDRGSVQRGFGWFFLGAGAVGIGGGAYFGTQWLNDRKESALHCHGNSCDPSGTSLRDDENVQRDRTTVSATVGGVAAVLGSILLVSAPSPRVVRAADANGTVDRAAHGIRVVPVVGASEQGVSVAGSW